MPLGCADLDGVELNENNADKNAGSVQADPVEAPDPIDLRLTIWNQGVEPLVIDGVKPLNDP